MTLEAICHNQDLGDLVRFRMPTLFLVSQLLRTDALLSFTATANHMRIAAGSLQNFFKTLQRILRTYTVGTHRTVQWSALI